MLEPVQQRIERCRLEPDPPLRALVDQLADLVTVAGPVLDQRQDQEFGAAFLELAIEARGYRLHNNILPNNPIGRKLARHGCFRARGGGPHASRAFRATIAVAMKFVAIAIASAVFPG